MDKSEKEKELDKYYVSKYEFEKSKAEIQRELDTKINQNKDRIEEVDDKFTDKLHELQRGLDNHTQSMGVLNGSVKSLDESVNKLSDTMLENIEGLRNVQTRVEKTESNLSDKELAKQQRRIETLKFISVLTTGLLGAGGLLSWLGPAIFGGK